MKEMDHGEKKILTSGNVLNYWDPIIALETLFSSLLVAKIYILQPSMTPLEEDPRRKIYSTPPTKNWRYAMQVSFLNHEIVKKNKVKIIQISI